MTEGSRTRKAAQAARRQQRLAAQLRANLKKRKPQARDRAENEGPAGGSDEQGPQSRTEGIR